MVNEVQHPQPRERRGVRVRSGALFCWPEKALADRSLSCRTRRVVMDKEAVSSATSRPAGRVLLVCTAPARGRPRSLSALMGASPRPRFHLERTAWRGEAIAGQVFMLFAT
jgi:hypothetical protein